MNQESIIFNPEQPIAHYEKSRRMYSKVKTILQLGTFFSLASFILGVICMALNADIMAFHALMGVPFTLLSIIGCQTRRAKICLSAVPMGIVAAITMIISGSVLSLAGFIAYLVSSYIVFTALKAIETFYKLKELPGFPLFDASLDDISFAAMDNLGSAEFIDESVLFEEVKAERFIAPFEPSEDMDEIVTEDMPAEEKVIQVSLLKNDFTKELSNDTDSFIEHEIAEKPENAYEKMIMLQKGQSNNSISDIDLLG